MDPPRSRSSPPGHSETRSGPPSIYSKPQHGSNLEVDPHHVCEVDSTPLSLKVATGPVALHGAPSNNLITDMSRDSIASSSGSSTFSSIFSLSSDLRELRLSTSTGYSSLRQDSDPTFNSPWSPVRRKDSSENPHRCLRPFCDFSFESVDELRRHERDIHERDGEHSVGPFDDNRQDFPQMATPRPFHRSLDSGGDTPRRSTSPEAIDDAESPMSLLPPPGDSNYSQQVTPRLAATHPSTPKPLPTFADGGNRSIVPPSTIMVTINEPAKQTMALPALPGTGKGGVPLDMAWHPVKHGSLRRIDSERNLSLTRSGAAFRALDQHQIQRPRTAMALRPSDRSSVSTRSTPDRDLDTTSQSSLSPALLHQESFGRASPDWLSVSNPNTTPSVKSHSGSSIMSSHTVDDDSASELSSDDSLSEPDSWPGLDDNPAVTKVWSKSFHQAMDREMIQLWVQYNRDWDALIQKCTGGPNSNSPRVGESTGWAQNTTSSSHHAPPGQGLRLPTRHPIDEEDEDDELEKHRPNSSQSKNSSSAPKRFACPFRKHNPRVYNIKEHEVCAVKDWPTISRLKEHLYRRHYKIHCPRCKVIFNDARGLASHEMLPLGCEVIDAVPPGDITAAQEKQLKSRSRKHAARRQTDEEKWEDIYRLLFQVPLEESVPSPYPEFVEDLGPISPESKNKLGLQHFLLTEMPQFFRQTAEAYAGRQIQAHEVVRMEDIPKLIEESLKRAFKAWEDRLSNSAPQASPTSSFVTSEVTAPSPNLWRDTPRTNPYMQGQATYIGGVEPAITPGYNWIPPPDLSHLNTLFPVSDPNDSGFGDGNYLPTSSGDSYANFDAAIGGTLMGDGGSDMSTANWGSF